MNNSIQTNQTNSDVSENTINKLTRQRLIDLVTEFRKNNETFFPNYEGEIIGNTDWDKICNHSRYMYLYILSVDNLGNPPPFPDEKDFVTLNELTTYQLMTLEEGLFRYISKHFNWNLKKEIDFFNTGIYWNVVWYRDTIVRPWATECLIESLEKNKCLTKKRIHELGGFGSYKYDLYDINDIYNSIKKIYNDNSYQFLK